MRGCAKSAPPPDPRRIPLTKILDPPLLKMSSFEGRAVHQLRYQLHSAEGRAKCPTVPQLRELVIFNLFMFNKVVQRGFQEAAKSVIFIL